MLGLDPGSRLTGWGLVERRDRQLHVRDFGCLRPRRGSTRATALRSLVEGLEELMARLAPDVVAVETPFTAKFPRAALLLAEARGALLAELGRWGGDVVEYEPARVKAVVVGLGNADKRQVAYIVRHELALATVPSEDAADALAIALCHLRLTASAPAGRRAPAPRPGAG